MLPRSVGGSGCSVVASNAHHRQILDIVCKLADRHLRRYLRLRLDLEAWCDQQDVYSKGESPTTAQIRKIITDTWDSQL